MASGLRPLPPSPLLCLLQSRLMPGVDLPPSSSGLEPLIGGDEIKEQRRGLLMSIPCASRVLAGGQQLRQFTSPLLLVTLTTRPALLHMLPSPCPPALTLLISLIISTSSHCSDIFDRLHCSRFSALLLSSHLHHQPLVASTAPRRVISHSRCRTSCHFSSLSLFRSKSSQHPQEAAHKVGS